MQRQNNIAGTLGSLFGAVRSMASAFETAGEVLDEGLKGAVPVAEAQQVIGKAYKEKKILEVSKDKLLFMKELEAEISDFDMTIEDLRKQT